jgi:hypothetical protein
MRNRHLALSKETLVELCTDEMLEVVGAAEITSHVECVKNLTSQVVNCYTIFKPCTPRVPLHDA